MTKEIPIELMTVKDRLRTRFSGLVPEAQSGTAEERERNFLSRALAALAVERLGKCTPSVAASSIVDGGGDGGIDAVYFSQGASTLWIVQSKFISDGDGQPDLSGVSKFKNGIEYLLKGDFVSFQGNAAWRKRIPEVERYLANKGLQVRAVLVYSGIRLISEDKTRLLDEIGRRFNNDDPDYFQSKSCGLTTIFDWITDADEARGVAEVALTIEKPGWLRKPYETVYGLVPLGELAGLYVKHGKRLVAANIRAFKGHTEVNDKILQTLREEPQHFFYLNNGLTAYCTRLEVDNRDRDDSNKKRIRAFGFSVVNGAQTLGAIASHAADARARFPSGMAFIRIISLEHCDDDEAFAERITRSTNFQNQVGAVDFISLDEGQERMARQLKPSGVTYHYREDLETPEPDEQNFLLKEALTACACLEQDKNCDLVARIVRYRASLLSMEPEAPATDSRYSRVFLPGRSARTVWRAVQAQRIIIGIMRESARATSGNRHAFFENARWLLQNVLFLLVKPDQGNDLELPMSVRERLERWTGEAAEELWEVCRESGLVGSDHDGKQVRGFKAIFGNAEDCRRLRGALIQRLKRLNWTIPDPSGSVLDEDDR